MNSVRGQESISKPIKCYNTIKGGEKEKLPWKQHHEIVWTTQEIRQVAMRKLKPGLGQPRNVWRNPKSGKIISRIQKETG